MKDFEELEGFEPPKKPARELALEVNGVMFALFSDPKMMVASQLKAAWEDLAPQEILNHTGAIFISSDSGRREVVVMVDTPMIAAELNARSFTLMVKLATLISEKYPLVGKIDSLRFQVSRSVRRNQKFEKRRAEEPSYIERAEPIELDEEELGQVFQTSSQIPDERLRKAFEKAMKANLEWKKGLRTAKRP